MKDEIGCDLFGGLLFRQSERSVLPAGTSSESTVLHAIAKSAVLPRFRLHFFAVRAAILLRLWRPSKRPGF